MITVTGGAGFIGSAVVRALLDRGEKEILVVDVLGKQGKFKNLRRKDIQGIATPEEFLKEYEAGTVNPSVIIHMGADSHTTQMDADYLLDNNSVYTRKLGLISQLRGTRLIYASSASVYGNGDLGFSDSDELTPKLEPMNPYGYSKWLGDMFALRDGWSKTHVGLRFFNVFGPNEYHKGGQSSVMLPAFRQARETGKIRLFESHRDDYPHGGQTRDFVYVKDVVKVILWFIDNPKTAGIYNVGTGAARTFNDLANSVFAALGQESNIEYIPTPEALREHYQYFTEADLTKLRSVGCNVEFGTLEETVKDYVQEYLAKEAYW